MTQDSTARIDAGRHAVVGVIVEEGQFLVIRRSPFVKAPGLLCFPGGGIEAGEDFPTAIRREFLEELHLPIEVHSHLWTSETRWGTRLEWMVCSRQPIHEPRANPEEVSEVLWMELEHLIHRDDLLGSMPEFFRAIREGRLEIRQ